MLVKPNPVTLKPHAPLPDRVLTPVNVNVVMKVPVKIAQLLIHVIPNRVINMLRASSKGRVSTPVNVNPVIRVTAKNVVKSIIVWN